VAEVNAFDADTDIAHNGYTGLQEDCQGQNAGRHRYTDPSTIGFDFKRDPP